MADRLPNLPRHSAWQIHIGRCWRGCWCILHGQDAGTQSLLLSCKEYTFTTSFQAAPRDRQKEVNPTAVSTRGLDWLHEVNMSVFHPSHLMSIMSIMSGRAQRPATHLSVTWSEKWDLPSDQHLFIQQCTRWIRPHWKDQHLVRHRDLRSTAAL